MLAADAPAPFDDPAFLFEPWWPGTRVIAFIEGGSVRLQAAELADVGGTFPELADLPSHVRAPDAIIDGTVLVLDRSGRPDPGLLRRRLLGIGPTLGRPAFVAADLLWASGRRLSRVPFATRRERLRGLLGSTGWCTVGRGYPGEGRTLAAAAADLGFASLSAHRLDAPYRAGDAGDAWVRIAIRDSPGAPPRLPPILAVFRRLPLEDAR
jgi:bifunctional non-homologous end joining protein LigD